jgi:hypothetical protein
MAYDPRIYDSHYTSSSDSDEEPDQSQTTPNPTSTSETKDDEIQPEVNEETKIEDIKSKLEQALVEVQNLKNACDFWKSEFDRANARLASLYNSQTCQKLQSTIRQRELTQYGCRTCGKFPKKTMCICPKAKKSKKIKLGN